MSYDLFVFKPIPGRNPDEVIDELLECDETDESGAAADPDLQDFANDVEQQTCGQACCNATQYVCEINISYGIDDSVATPVFQQVLQCIQRWNTERGLLAYDPQSGEVVEPRRALVQFAESNKQSRAALRNIANGATESDTPTNSKPWWKFW